MQVANFFLVLAVATGIACGVGFLFASGLRLLVGDEGRQNQVGSARKALAYLCFAGCVAVVVYALYLIIPVFH
jgi:hypothetical protein